MSKIDHCLLDSLTDQCKRILHSIYEGPGQSAQTQTALDLRYLGLKRVYVLAKIRVVTKSVCVTVENAHNC